MDLDEEDSQFDADRIGWSSIKRVDQSGQHAWRPDNPENELEIDWDDYWLAPRMFINLFIARKDMLLVSGYSIMLMYTVQNAITKYCESDSRRDASLTAETCKSKYEDDNWTLYMLSNVGVYYSIIAVLYYIVASEMYLYDYGRLGYVRRQMVTSRSEMWKYIMFSGAFIGIFVCFVLSWRFYEPLESDSLVMTSHLGLCVYLVLLWLLGAFHYNQDVLFLSKSADCIDFNQYMWEDPKNVLEELEDALLILILRNDDMPLRRYGVNDWEIACLVYSIGVNEDFAEIQDLLNYICCKYASMEFEVPVFEDNALQVPIGRQLTPEISRGYGNGENYNEQSIVQFNEVPNVRSFTQDSVSRSQNTPINTPPMQSLTRSRSVHRSRMMTNEPEQRSRSIHHSHVDDYK